MLSCCALNVELLMKTQKDDPASVQKWGGGNERRILEYAERFFLGIIRMMQVMQKDVISRRRFLKKVAVAAAGSAGFPYILRASALGAEGTVAPSNKVVMGCIGVGSMGGGHLRWFLRQPDVRVAAICDVREMFRQKAKQSVDSQYGDSACATYNDFRELLARPDIDAVTIVTPEHWHGLIAIEAAKQGKSMYCEKPLDVHVAAAKAVREMVKRKGVVFQLGTQQRSDANFRQACELARNGRLGKLHTVMVGSYPSPYFENQPNEPTPDKKEFDYDMWLGPAPWSPYSFQRAASRAMGTIGVWTHIYDYSLGGLSGAWGIHHVDIAQWGIGADNTGPIEVEGTGEFPTDGIADTTTKWEVAHKYANGVTMIHMDTKTALERAPQMNIRNGVGILFLGAEGWVFVERGTIKAQPEWLLREVIRPDEIRLYRSNNHQRNFLDCVKTKSRTICPVETAVRSDTVCHLDDIAMRLKRKLRWDPVKEEFIGDAEADKMLTRPLRSPWRV